MRRDFVNCFKFAQILLWGGFFVFCAYGAWQAQAHFSADLLPMHDGNLANNAAWQYANCDQGSASGNDYLVLKKSTSTVISPGLDLAGLAEVKVIYQARTYNGITGSSNSVIISLSTDEGNSWLAVATATPLSSTLAAMPKLDLSGYAGQIIRLKFETPQATGSKGAGLDEIKISGRLANQLPLASLFATPTTAAIGEPVFFDSNNSTDTDGFVVSYFWNFGDGGEANLATTSYNYLSAGDFTATLTVADDDGATSSAAINITITSSTPAETTSTPTSTPTIATTTETGNIVINEFLSDPNDGTKEWLELYNKTTSSVDLAGWTFSDNAATTTVSGIIGTTTVDEYFLIEFNSGRLNNSGDSITICDGSGKLINQIAYGNYSDGDITDNAPVPNKSYSSARITDGQDSSNNKTDFAETITPTKGGANVITPRQISGGGGNGYTQPPVSQPATTTTTTIVSYPPIASGTAIAINELFPNPTGSDEEAEFIELKNIGVSDVDLAGWSLSDATDKKFQLANSGIDWKIKANGFLAIKRSLSQIALNNSGLESVKLFTPVGQVWDELQYSGPAAENQSYSRDSEGEFYWTASSTPGSENIFDPPLENAVTSTQVLGIKIASFSEYKAILISEIFPNPDSKNSLREFIELYNPGNEPLDLSGFVLTDQSDRIYALKNKIIATQGYLVILQTESKINLNNDGDNLTLKDSTGRTVAQLSYQKAPQDYSLALNGNGQYQWTNIITPGQINKFSNPPTDETASSDKKANKNTTISVPLETIRDYDNGQKIKTTGTVSVEPKILGANIFYLAGSGLPATLRVAMPAGIQIYCYKKDFPDLKLGDSIEVTGELAESGGERRLKITDRSAIKIISHDEPPLPQPVAMSDIGENYEGSLVVATGQVIETKGRYLYLDDGSEEAKIYLRESINVQDLNIEEADHLSVTGIVSQTSGGYRLLPRYSSDIIKETSSPTSTATTAAAPAKNYYLCYLAATTIFLLAIAGVVGVKYYKKISKQKNRFL